jgi:hypothetical protein
VVRVSAHFVVQFFFLVAMDSLDHFVAQFSMVVVIGFLLLSIVAKPLSLVFDGMAPFVIVPIIPAD